LRASDIDWQNPFKPEDLDKLSDLDPYSGCGLPVPQNVKVQACEILNARFQELLKDIKDKDELWELLKGSKKNTDE